MSDGFELDTRLLDKLLRALGEVPSARVGVLGVHNHRKEESDNDNASIGLKHEFGKEGMPVRSFLRIPIIERLEKTMEKNGAFDTEMFQETVKKGDFTEFIRRLGITGEQVVAEAFATGGFGKWKQSNMARKKIKQTLVETTQLRDSITSEVI